MKLSQSQINNLIAKNASPEEVKEALTTVEEVAYYFASRKSKFNDNIHSLKEGYCLDGKTCLQLNGFCCCGGAANTVLYLLDGDFERSGILRWCGGRDASHVIVWLKQGKYYYVLDSAILVQSGYRRSTRYAILERLTDFKKVFNQMNGFGLTLSDEHIIFAFENKSGESFTSRQLKINTNKKMYQIEIGSKFQSSKVIIYQDDKTELKVV